MRILSPVLIASLLAFGAAPAAAQTNSMMTVQHPNPHPIKVSACNPQRNRMTSMSPGYMPGYYPGRPYYWNDVYGQRYYQPAYTTSESPTLNIDYMNVTQHTMKSIEFGLIARGALIAEVRDVGTFSPNVEIKHKFGISANVFPIGTGLPKCVPLRITFDDGSKWKNPHLPSLSHSIYGHP